MGIYVAPANISGRGTEFINRENLEGEHANFQKYMGQAGLLSPIRKGKCVRNKVANLEHVDTQRIRMRAILGFPAHQTWQNSRF